MAGEVRIRGTEFRPRVFQQGQYTIQVGELGTSRGKVLQNVASLDPRGAKTMELSQ